MKNNTENIELAKDKTIVIETMNRIILEHGVYTCVKVDGALLIVEPQAKFN